MPFRVETVILGVAGTPYLSVMHFDGTGGTQAQAAADAVSTFWGGIQSAMSSTLTAEVQPEVVEFTLATGQPTGVHSVTGSSTTGSEAGEPLPWATQGLIRWRTGFFAGGREVRGRTFIPGPTENRSTAGRPDSAYQTDLQNAASALIGNAEANFGVYSPTKAAFASATASSVWGQWAVMTSRRD